MSTRSSEAHNPRQVYSTFLMSVLLALVVYTWHLHYTVGVQRTFHATAANQHPLNATASNQTSSNTSNHTGTHSGHTGIPDAQPHHTPNANVTLFRGTVLTPVTILFWTILSVSLKLFPVLYDPIHNLYTKHTCMEWISPMMGIVLNKYLPDRFILTFTHFMAIHVFVILYERAHAADAATLTKANAKLGMVYNRPEMLLNLLVSLGFKILSSTGSSSLEPIVAAFLALSQLICPGIPGRLFDSLVPSVSHAYTKLKLPEDFMHGVTPMATMGALLYTMWVRGTPHHRDVQWGMALSLLVFVTMHAADAIKERSKDTVRCMHKILRSMLSLLEIILEVFLEHLKYHNESLAQATRGGTTDFPQSASSTTTDFPQSTRSTTTDLHQLVSPALWTVLGGGYILLCENTAHLDTVTAGLAIPVLALAVQRTYQRLKQPATRGKGQGLKNFISFFMHLTQIALNTAVFGVLVVLIHQFIINMLAVVALWYLFHAVNTCVFPPIEPDVKKIMAGSARVGIATGKTRSTQPVKQRSRGLGYLITGAKCISLFISVSAIILTVLTLFYSAERARTSARVALSLMDPQLTEAFNLWSINYRSCGKDPNSQECIHALQKLDCVCGAKFVAWYTSLFHPTVAKQIPNLCFTERTYLDVFFSTSKIPEDEKESITSLWEFMNIQFPALSAAYVRYKDMVQQGYKDFNVDNVMGIPSEKTIRNLFALVLSLIQYPYKGFMHLVKLMLALSAVQQ